MTMRKTTKFVSTFGLAAALLVSGIAFAPVASAAGGSHGCPAGVAIKLNTVASGSTSTHTHAINSGTSVATGRPYSNSWSYSNGSNRTTVTGAVSAASWQTMGIALRSGKAYC